MTANYEALERELAEHRAASEAKSIQMQGYRDQQRRDHRAAMMKKDEAMELERSMHRAELETKANAIERMEALVHQMTMLCAGERSIQGQADGQAEQLATTPPAEHVNSAATTSQTMWEGEDQAQCTVA